MKFGQPPQSTQHVVKSWTLADEAGECWRYFASGARRWNSRPSFFRKEARDVSRYDLLHKFGHHCHFGPSQSCELAAHDLFHLFGNTMFPFQHNMCTVHSLCTHDRAISSGNRCSFHALRSTDFRWSHQYSVQRYLHVSTTIGHGILSLT